jgi:hypothetical protein
MPFERKPDAFTVTNGAAAHAPADTLKTTYHITTEEKLKEKYGIKSSYSCRNDQLKKP